MQPSDINRKTIDLPISTTFPAMTVTLGGLWKSSSRLAGREVSQLQLEANPPLLVETTYSMTINPIVPVRHAQGTPPGF